MKAVLSILVAVVLFIGSSSVYIVNQWETAVVLRLGEIVKADVKPGLHFKMPFVNNVRRFDSRLQTLDSAPERFLTSEKKNLEVDSFVRWKIQDVAKFYTTMNGDFRLAGMRLGQIVKDGLRAEFGNRTVKEVISGERVEIAQKIKTATAKTAESFGIEIEDVRIKRIDLAQDISESVYRRMEAERKRVAKDLRSKGAEAAEKIRADADRQRSVILAEAYSQAEIIRGEGDAQAADIYAKAYNLDPEFYSFYHSINAYQKSFKDKSDVMVVDPNSDFFKYFNNRAQPSAE
ncbi:MULTISPECIES: protease modulator HflC [Thiomicrorhabdus]|uniref:Protein HflC n=1 Tax=Thiomicrorhabdus xiamenensis TaxID=2739063 RepID=A0A7D4NKA3_9GAMM|nr:MULTISPECIES: protease modulator HflC [Thiomicrorhabdus]MBO1924043.1 protease modulator HflC [Thiomicrorhabdus sp. 6S3-12]QKI89069.1 protease modulator HflC [Thiomicrorhabdus xiamenensis]